MTIEEKIEEYADTFSFLEGLDKMEYLVDLAKKAPGLPPEERNEANRVTGCASETWVSVQGTPEDVVIQGDSEALIVKGMLYMLSDTVNHHTRDEILALDEQHLLESYGLGGSITNKRMNGFASALLKIKNQLQKL